MANSTERKTLREAEEQALDLISEASSTPQYGCDLLKSSLEVAVAEGKLGPSEEKLVDAGKDVGEALHTAVRAGHVCIAKSLLESGASANAKCEYGRAPLHVAAGLGDTQMVKLLLQKGGEIEGDNLGRSPLFNAVFYGQLAATQALLAAGAEVKRRDEDIDDSAIFAAVERGHVGILRALLEHEANVEGEIGMPTTPLHVAAQLNNVEAIDVLVEYGADVEAQSDHTGLPLHCAAVHMKLEAVVALLKHGANANAADDSNYTPLHDAVSTPWRPGTADLVDTLLRSGADEKIINDNGDSPLDIVRRKYAGQPLVDEFQRVYKLLANAPSDRAWRRRGYLVLCRARLDRAQLASAKARSGVIPKVVGLQEEGIFRMIMDFL
ncbi:unnamed protein product [Hapterophycus canaliculatus]